MRPAISRRPSLVATSSTPVLIAIALFVTLLIGAPGAHAAAPTPPTAAPAQLEEDLFRDNSSPDYHRANAEYWRVKGAGTAARRPGLFGWLLPKRTRHELAEKRRTAHRAPQSAHYHGRGGRKANVWQVLGLAD